MPDLSRFAPWIAALLVLAVLGGALPGGLLAGRQGWFTALFWPLFGAALLVVIAAAIHGRRNR